MYLYVSVDVDFFQIVTREKKGSDANSSLHTAETGSEYSIAECPNDVLDECRTCLQ